MESPPLVKTTQGRGRSSGPQGETRRIILYFTGLIMLGFFITHAGAAGKPTSKEIYLYQGADRDLQLVEKAKKEGTVTNGTTLSV